MIFIVGIVFLITVFFALAEAYYEHDIPRRTIIFAIVMAIALLCSVGAQAQNSRYDYFAATTTGSGNLLPLLVIPGATVNFYTGCTSLPCSTYANVYNSASGAIACPITAQIVLNDASACVAVADGEGNFGGWFLPGQYQYTITAFSATYGPYSFTIGYNSGSFSFPISIGNGGTGQTTQAMALTALLGASTVPIANGGTGQATGIAALNALGVANGTTPIAFGNPFTVPSVNKVVYADAMTGSDIGAKITAAFASQAGTSANPQSAVKVVLNPNQVYQVSTAFSIPNSTAAPYIVTPVLDCQGATLEWNGSGDFITVLEENSNGPSGFLENCFINNGGSNTSSVNLVHQQSRVGFYYINDEFGFESNSGGSGLLLDNTATSWGGYSERTHIVNSVFQGNTKSIRLLGSDGGTGSFARTVIQGSSCNVNAAQYCLSVEGTGSAESAYVYNSYIDLRGNMTSSGVGVLVENGGQIALGVINLGFEGGTYLVAVNDINSGINSEYGILDGNGIPNFLCTGCTSAFINVFTSESGDLLIQQAPNANGSTQTRNSKFLLNYGSPAGTYGSLRYGIASNGGTESNDGYVQWFARNTTATTDPEVDCTTGCLSAQVNVMLSNKNGTGFGAGYGYSTATGGTTLPTNPIEVAGGTFSVGAAGTVNASTTSITSAATASGVLNVTQTGTGSFAQIEAFSPNLNTSASAVNLFGAAGSANNSIAILFNNVGGSGSTSNTGSIGLNSGSLTTFDHLGDWNMPGTVTASELKTTQTPTASATVSTYSVPIVLNGTTYYIRLSTTP